MSDNNITLDALAVEEKKVEIEQERDELFNFFFVW